MEAVAVEDDGLAIFRASDGANLTPQELRDGWRPYGHDYIGELTLQWTTPSGLSVGGMILAWIPAHGDRPARFRSVHTKDGVTEDLDEEEVKDILVGSSVQGVEPTQEEQSVVCGKRKAVGEYERAAAALLDPLEAIELAHVV